MDNKHFATHKQKAMGWDPPSGPRGWESTNFKVMRNSTNEPKRMSLEIKKFLSAMVITIYAYVFYHLLIRVTLSVSEDAIKPIFAPLLWCHWMEGK